MNCYAEYRPRLWQRIAWWRRWPWRPRQDPDALTYGQKPYVVMVRENGVIIGWHPIGRTEGTTVIQVSRWTCLAGLVTGRLTFEISIDRDQRFEEESDL